MDYAELFYENNFGCYPFKSDEPMKLTQKTIQHLEDAKIPKETIRRFIESAPKHDYIWYTSLYDQRELLYTNTLLEHDVFYYHPRLQIRPPAPVFDPFKNQSSGDSFYLEMQIRFSKEDAVAYAREKLKLPMELSDIKRDIGSIDYLLNKYSKITLVKPIDFILFLVDEMTAQTKRTISILDITQVEQDVFDKIHRMVPELAAKKANRIIWR